jgi:hypothetical protein
VGLLNVSHSTMTQSVIDLQEDLLKNPFYLFNDKKALPVDYYNINNNQSTLDKGLKTNYDNDGKDTPFRYNLIHDFYLYGIDRVATSLESGDFGISGSEISGDAYILPDTITPYPGDHFVINMVKQRYQFIVSSVSTDTFDNGGNYYKIEYTLLHNDDSRLTGNVTEEFRFVSGNIGTEYTPVLQSQKYDVCKNLDDVCVNLKQLFKGLYFNNKVQTYTFVHLYHICQTGMDSDYFYDPYMIEFCIRNKVLYNSGEKYDYIDHKTTLKPDFNIKYNKSIWKVIENREKDLLPECKHSSAALYIDDPGTIFSTRYENYFELTYAARDTALETYASALNILDPQIIGHILENQLFPSDSKYAKYNLLIKYFNFDDHIGTEDILPLERIIETENTMENYFLIPMIIYIIEFNIKNTMARVPKSSK